MSLSIRFATFVAVLALPDVSRIDPGARRESASCRDILRRYTLLHADLSDQLCTIPRIVTQRHCVVFDPVLSPSHRSEPRGRAWDRRRHGESRREDSTRGSRRAGTDHTIELCRHAPLGTADRAPTVGPSPPSCNSPILEPVKAGGGHCPPRKEYSYRRQLTLLASAYFGSLTCVDSGPGCCISSAFTCINSVSSPRRQTMTISQIRTGRDRWASIQSPE